MEVSRFVPDNERHQGDPQVHRLLASSGEIMRLVERSKKFSAQAKTVKNKDTRSENIQAEDID